MKKSIIAFYAIGGSFLVSVLSCNNATSSNADTPKTDTVLIENMQFQPGELVIHKGDTVIWINKGIVGHNVTNDPDASWTSGNIEVGKSWKTVPKENLKYFCTIHPTMKGTITVQ
jgi:plastocyanin